MAQRWCVSWVEAHTCGAVVSSRHACMQLLQHAAADCRYGDAAGAGQPLLMRLPPCTVPHGCSRLPAARCGRRSPASPKPPARCHPWPAAQQSSTTKVMKINSARLPQVGASMHIVKRLEVCATCATYASLACQASALHTWQQRASASRKRRRSAACEPARPPPCGNMASPPVRIAELAPMAGHMRACAAAHALSQPAALSLSM